MSEQGEASRSWPGSWDSPALRGAALLTAAAVWTCGILHQSLWEDEFHSMYHARAGSVLALLERVRGDNHPPLSFLLQQASRALLGESALAIRLPSLLAGLGMLAVFQRLARRLEDPHARGLAPWLAVGSSYLFWIVTSARMYALVALTTVGLTESVLSALEGRRSRWWIAPWIAAGLHSHYAFFHDLALFGLVAIGLHATSPGLRPRIRSCALPAAAGLLLFAPWCAYAFVHQLGTGNPPTASLRGFRVWIESHAHFFFLNAHAAGALTSMAVVGTGLLAGAVLAILGSARLIRALRGEEARRANAALVLVLGILGPSWIYLFSLVHPRLGFHLKYLASFGPYALLIVAAGVDRALWRRAGSAILLAAMFVVTIANAFSRGRQDVEGAVSAILERARPGDAVIVRPWYALDPERSPTDFGWYAHRLARGRSTPAEIPIDQVMEALEYPRVWLIHVGAFPSWILNVLDRSFRSVEITAFGPGATVYLYADARDGG